LLKLRFRGKGVTEVRGFVEIFQINAVRGHAAYRDGGVFGRVRGVKKRVGWYST